MSIKEPGMRELRVALIIKISFRVQRPEIRAIVAAAAGICRRMLS